jgi:hypothetical protein
MGMAAAGVSLVLLVLASPAASDLLRCKGADGKTIFTDDPAMCPGADPYEPDATVLRAEDSVAPAAAPSREEARAQRKRAAEAEAGEARRWRQKRLDKEAELEAIAERRQTLKEFVTWCNRGGSVVTYDDAGIEQDLPCNQLRDEFHELDRRQASIEAYLAEGLQEECRRAGCLPGWLR